MDSVIIDGVKYEKLDYINIGKYQYLLLINDNTVYCATEDNNNYNLYNSDLTLEGNANKPLSDLNSRIIVNHIKILLEQYIVNSLDYNVDELVSKIKRYQETLLNPEFYNLIKGNMNEISNFDEEVSLMIDKFDELNNETTTVIKPIVEQNNNKVDLKKELDETANIDTFMIALITNIGILLFIMLVLNIVR